MCAQHSNLAPLALLTSLLCYHCVHDSNLNMPAGELLHALQPNLAPTCRIVETQFAAVMSPAYTLF